MIDLTRKWYFSPQDDTKDAYLTFLQAATKSIRIADYSFNLPEFETILPALKTKGIDVELVLDKSQSAGSTEKPVIQALQAAGINMVIGTSSDHKIMHNKYTIVDDNWIQYGSWNYTTAASDEDNFFCIENNPSLAQIFLVDWNGMKSWIVAHQPQGVFNQSNKES